MIAVVNPNPWQHLMRMGDLRNSCSLLGQKDFIQLKTRTNSDIFIAHFIFSHGLQNSMPT